MKNNTNNLTTEMLLGISKKFGNAFYLLNSTQFRENYLELSKAFSDIYPNFNIAYSYKTNYTPALCKIVNELGGYAEVVSEMEMKIALRCGVLPEKIIWNGPVKSAHSVESLLISGGTVNLDSIHELDLIHSVAERNPGCTLNVGIRCNFDVGDDVVSRFGFDVCGNDFNTALNFIKKMNKENEMANIHLINIQCHFAKRSVEYWPARTEGMLKIADRVDDILGYYPERIDLGGGIFGKMSDSLKTQFPFDIPDYNDYARAAAIKFSEHFKNVATPPELLIEPGSALAGDSMKFVAEVANFKTVRGKSFVTLLGSQKNISMTGVNPPIEIYHAGEFPHRFEDADLVGYTCIESDVLYRGFSGKLSVGDFVVFGNCGSYSIVMKPPFIMENFPILDICDDFDNPKVIKRGECFDDLFLTFNF